MAKLEARPKIELEVVLRLNESEARFLEGLSGFDAGTILDALRACVGKHYTEDRAPEPGGFFSLMESCRRDLPLMLERAEKARQVFDGLAKAAPLEVKR